MKIKKLHYETVSDLLKTSLIKLMHLEEFKPFILVGGTALSLQIGYRQLHYSYNSTQTFLPFLSIQIVLILEIGFAFLNSNKSQSVLIDSVETPFISSTLSPIET